MKNKHIAAWLADKVCAVWDNQLIGSLYMEMHPYRKPYEELVRGERTVHCSNQVQWVVHRTMRACVVALDAQMQELR